MLSSERYCQVDKVLDGVRAIQVYTDGSFVDGRGAAAMVIVCVRDSAQNFESELLGSKGWHLQKLQSAFHSEVSALDAAIELLLAAVSP